MNPTFIRSIGLILSKLNKKNVKIKIDNASPIAVIMINTKRVKKMSYITLK